MEEISILYYDASEQTSLILQQQWSNKCLRQKICEHLNIPVESFVVVGKPSGRCAFLELQTGQTPTTITVFGHVLSPDPSTSRDNAGGAVVTGNTSTYLSDILLESKKRVIALKVLTGCMDVAVSDVSASLSHRMQNVDVAKAKVTHLQQSQEEDLQNFQSYLDRLKAIPLHPALHPHDMQTHATSIDDDANCATRGGGCNSCVDDCSSTHRLTRQMTLLDTLRVDQFDSWLVQAKTSHCQVQQLVGTINTATGELQGDLSLVQQDYIRLAAHLLQLEGYLAIMEKEVGGLQTRSAGRRNHSNTISSPQNDCGDDEDDEDGVFCRIRQESERVVHDCHGLIRKFSGEMLRDLLSMRSRLVSLYEERIPSCTQAAAQMLSALTRINPNHRSCLEVIKYLPKSYDMFLKEIARRQRYNQEFSSFLAKAQHQLHNMRKQEIRHRQFFLSHSGQQLPHFFYEVVPSLCCKPCIDETETLPSINGTDSGHFQEPHTHQQISETGLPVERNVQSPSADVGVRLVSALPPTVAASLVTPRSNEHMSGKDDDCYHISGNVVDEDHGDCSNSSCEHSQEKQIHHHIQTLLSTGVTATAILDTLLRSSYLDDHEPSAVSELLLRYGSIRSSLTPHGESIPGLSRTATCSSNQTSSGITIRSDGGSVIDGEDCPIQHTTREDISPEGLHSILEDGNMLGEDGHNIDGYGRGVGDDTDRHMHQQSPPGSSDITSSVPVEDNPARSSCMQQQEPYSSDKANTSTYESDEPFTLVGVAAMWNVVIDVVFALVDAGLLVAVPPSNETLNAISRGTLDPIFSPSPSPNTTSNIYTTHKTGIDHITGVDSSPQANCDKNLRDGTWVVPAPDFSDLRKQMQTAKSKLIDVQQLVKVTLAADDTSVDASRGDSKGLMLAANPSASSQDLEHDSSFFHNLFRNTILRLSTYGKKCPLVGWDQKIFITPAHEQLATDVIRNAITQQKDDLYVTLRELSGLWDMVIDDIYALCDWGAVICVPPKDDYNRSIQLESQYDHNPVGTVDVSCEVRDGRSLGTMEDELCVSYRHHIHQSSCSRGSDNGSDDGSHGNDEDEPKHKGEIVFESDGLDSSAKRLSYSTGAGSYWSFRRFGLGKKALRNNPKTNPRDTSSLTTLQKMKHTENEKKYEINEKTSHPGIYQCADDASVGAGSAIYITRQSDLCLYEGAEWDSAGVSTVNPDSGGADCASSGAGGAISYHVSTVLNEVINELWRVKLPPILDGDISAGMNDVPIPYLQAYPPSRRSNSHHPHMLAALQLQEKIFGSDLLISVSHLQIILGMNSVQEVLQFLHDGSELATLRIVTCGQESYAYPLEVDTIFTSHKLLSICMLLKMCKVDDNAFVMTANGGDMTGCVIGFCKWLCDTDDWPPRCVASTPASSRYRKTSQEYGAGNDRRCMTSGAAGAGSVSSRLITGSATVLGALGLPKTTIPTIESYSSIPTASHGINQSRYPHHQESPFENSKLKLVQWLGEMYTFSTDRHVSEAKKLCSEWVEKVNICAQHIPT